MHAFGNEKHRVFKIHCPNEYFYRRQGLMDNIARFSVFRTDSLTQGSGFDSHPLPFGQIVVTLIRQTFLMLEIRTPPRTLTLGARGPIVIFLRPV